MQALQLPLGDSEQLARRRIDQRSRLEVVEDADSAFSALFTTILSLMG
jgi:hypothetical protein